MTVNGKDDIEIDVVEDTDDVWRPEWIQGVIDFLQSLSNDERVQIFTDFCCRCGEPKTNGEQRCGCRP